MPRTEKVESLHRNELCDWKSEVRRLMPLK
jgi:hypothetical protein